MTLDKSSRQRQALQLVFEDGHGVGPRLARAAGVSRQVASQCLQELTRSGLIEPAGSTRARVYALKTVAELDRAFPREGLQEDRVWIDVLAPELADLPENVRNIWNYAATEMINNAIDHSGAAEVRVRLRRTALFSEVLVADNGEGIFLKIQRALDLYHPREAILELAKGKLTTAAEKHTGEGIFFTSRMVDAFDIRSGRLRFRHDRELFDVLSEDDDKAPGTRVLMRLSNDSPRTTSSVFDRFTDPEDYTFDKTVVPVRLAHFEGEGLVSRSQAKRVSHHFERFKRIDLDFEGVETIGLAFADELFRVYGAAHPEVRLVPINTSPAVARMVQRAVGAASESK